MACSNTPAFSRAEHVRFIAKRSSVSQEQYIKMSATIFNRNVKRLHRTRAARLLPGHEALLQETAARLTEPFGETILPQFPIAVDLGCRLGYMAEALHSQAGVKTLIQMDVSAMLQNLSGLRVVGDEELLPLQENSVNLIISNATLHWVNDLPGCLIQIRHALKEQGLFTASLFGGETLKELRAAIMAVADEYGMTPRLSPLIEVKDAGSLLQRAGFHLPVTESDVITVKYKDAFALMRDLRAMGETNALIKRYPYFTPKRTLFAIAEAYQELFGDEHGHIPATFDVITLTGWKS